MAYPKTSTRENKIVKPKKSIVSGNFPQKPSLYEKPAILKTNKILAFSLLMVVILSMTSYLFVLSKESRVKELHSATNKLNYENVELQNKVDYLKSFYVLDDKVQKIDFLKKPDQIIEVQSNTKTPIIVEKKKKFDITPVTGF